MPPGRQTVPITNLADANVAYFGFISKIKDALQQHLGKLGEQPTEDHKKTQKVRCEGMLRFISSVEVLARASIGRETSYYQRFAFLQLALRRYDEDFPSSSKTNTASWLRSLAVVSDADVHLAQIKAIIDDIDGTIVDSLFIKKQAAPLTPGLAAYVSALDLNEIFGRHREDEAVQIMFPPPGETALPLDAMQYKPLLPQGPSCSLVEMEQHAGALIKYTHIIAMALQKQKDAAVAAIPITAGMSGIASYFGGGIGLTFSAFLAFGLYDMTRKPNLCKEAGDPKELTEAAVNESTTFYLLLSHFITASRCVLSVEEAASEEAARLQTLQAKKAEAVSAANQAGLTVDAGRRLAGAPGVAEQAVVNAAEEQNQPQRAVVAATADPIVRARELMAAPNRGALAQMQQQEQPQQQDVRGANAVLGAADSNASNQGMTPQRSGSFSP